MGPRAILELAILEQASPREQFTQLPVAVYICGTGLFEVYVV